LYVLTLLAAMAIARAQPFPDPRSSWSTLLGNLLMLQDWGAVKPAVWVEVYAGILVLWSLSYEWWFYLLYFPLSRKIPVKAQPWVVSALTLSQALIYVWHPNQASRFLMYFSIWWTGVELARLKFAGKPFNLRSLAVPLGTVIAITAILGYDVWHEAALGIVLRSGTHPCLELRHFLAALVITGVALLWQKASWVGFGVLLGGFARAAPWSYALYLLHEPLALTADPFQPVSNPLIKALLNLILVVLAAWLAENYVQQWCRRLFRR
jgi:peptidoglycan/LPS O-acetylase OafA/YrhL